VRARFSRPRGSRATTPAARARRATLAPPLPSARDLTALARVRARVRKKGARRRRFFAPALGVSARGARVGSPRRSPRRPLTRAPSPAAASLGPRARLEMSGAGPRRVEPPVFYPTMADMRGSFEAYIESIEEDLEEFGIGRIVPPAGWTPRAQGYDDIDFTVNKAITQVRSRGDGRGEEGPPSTPYGANPSRARRDDARGLRPPDPFSTDVAFAHPRPRFRPVALSPRSISTPPVARVCFARCSWSRNL